MKKKKKHQLIRWAVEGEDVVIRVELRHLVELIIGDQINLDTGEGLITMAKQLLHLTRREQEVMRLLKNGNSNKEIANALNLAERTVKFHVSSLLAKAGVSNRFELVTQFKGEQYEEKAPFPGSNHHGRGIGISGMSATEQRPA